MKEQGKKPRKEGLYKQKNQEVQGMEKGIGDYRNFLEEGNGILGIELGSTRIKAVLIDSKGNPLASGSYAWENRLEHRIWTYSQEDVWTGVQAAYRELKKDVKIKWQVDLHRIGAMGISAMMHGYLVFDEKQNLLVPFRTWRNSITGPAARELTDLLEFHIPQRWSIAHLYQAILNGEDHLGKIDYMTTLAGYVHWRLTGEQVLGIGDASGMFPIDGSSSDYSDLMMEKFDQLAQKHGFFRKIRNLLPKVKVAGDQAGSLTREGALLLDPTGELEAGCPVCPPEGDAGTGMTATKSVAAHTGNISAGTSAFAMVVLDKDLSKVHPELDMVTTPDGKPVAMSHANNCTSDLNAWVGIFKEFSEVLGVKLDTGDLFRILYQKALEGEKDCGGLLAYGYLSGEPMTGLAEGRPLLVRMPDSTFHLANLMRVHLFTALGALKIGMDILREEEKVAVERLTGHGGLFKTPEVGQRIMAACMETPVAVRETAGEGGAWGIALLALYALASSGRSLEEFLDQVVFAESQDFCLEPDPEDVEGFRQFMKTYRKGLPIELAAVQTLSAGEKGEIVKC